VSTTSQLPRQQRKAQYNADLFERHRRMGVALSKELRRRYGRRSLPVRKGDTVRVLSGSYVGREERVAKVNLQKYSVTLDNVTGKTADAKLKPLPIRTSHLVLTKLNLADAWRRRILNVTEAPPDELPEPTDAIAAPADAKKEDE
jgi:large subunit ribosomal protein L24